MDVSVIIPTKNGARYLNRILNKLLKQQTQLQFEVIIIDSGSTDSTLDIIAKYKKVNLVKISPKEFGHGKTRNHGARLAKGEYLVFLTQDAIPQDYKWLDNLINTYSQDENIAGVYCRQIPRTFENPASVEGIKNWIAGLDKFYIEKLEDKSEFEKLSPLDKRLKVNFDNVASSVSRFPI